jgi:hypothetical protein
MCGFSICSLAQSERCPTRLNSQVRGSGCESHVPSSSMSRLGAEWCGLSSGGWVCEGLERKRGFEPPAACLDGRYSANLSCSHSMVPFLCRGQRKPWALSLLIMGFMTACDHLGLKGEGGQAGSYKVLGK